MLKHVSSFLFCLSLELIGLSQASTVSALDSLLSELDRSPSLESKIPLFNRLIFEHPDTAGYYLDLEYARIHADDYQAQARIIELKGMLLDRGGKLNAALAEYMKLKKLTEMHNDSSGMLRSYTLIANIYTFQGDLIRSQQQLLKALPLAENLDDRGMLRNIYQNLGSNYTHLRDG